ncbi:MAG: trypsin-like peptidase domain-containing protein [Paludibacteraceae bacterium]|nr:trypsin-like peptidase domain-containing protein [Paludibacteraceae bacterium]
MKRFYSLAALLLCVLMSISAQGLRHSICVVQPEFAEADRALMADYSLFMARAGMRSASQALTAYKNEGTFGSGVVVEQGGKKYVLTNLHVIGYAKKATLTFQLHEKTLRYEHCEVTNIGEADLAAVALPAECEMIALPLYAGEIDEDLSIVAAGFPGLAGKPSWQLTRGSISNARVDVDAHERASRIIQHTASIDPGSSGGPLLLKNAEGKYEILGINTWKAFYREGVGLAIGKEDIQAFLTTLSPAALNAHNEMDPLLNLSGEDWLYVFRNLPDSIQKNIKDLDWHLPLDPALRTLAVRDSLVSGKLAKSKHFESSASRVVKDMDRIREVRLIYDNYLGMNQQVGLQFGFDWLGYIITGVQFAALIEEAMTEDDVFGTKLGYKTRAGAMFGLYVGGQVPIQVGKHMLVPRITQSAGAGPMKTGNIDGGFALLTDTRAGLDWHIPFNSVDLVLGLHYIMDWQWTKNELKIPAYKPQSNRDSFNQYLQHGVGLTLGIAW